MTRDGNSGSEKILIVDDLEINVEILENIVRAEGYVPLCALSVKEALEIMNDDMPQLILSDYSMPEMNGIEFCQLLKKNPKTRDIPFILITVADTSDIKKAGFEAGAVDYIIKPFERMEVVARINHQITTYRAKQENIEYNRRMHRVIETQKELLEQEQRDLFLALSKLTRKLDDDLGTYLERISYNCKILSQCLQLTEKFESEVNDEFIDIISIVSGIHDIGMFMIKDKFDEDISGVRKECTADYIKLHTQAGKLFIDDIGEHVKESRYISMSRNIMEYHHARWDGSGFPEGVAGEDIPLEARIVSIVCGFDAELRRLDENDNAVSEAMDLICYKSGTDYDPDIVKVFAKISKRLMVS